MAQLCIVVVVFFFTPFCFLPFLLFFHLFLVRFFHLHLFQDAHILHLPPSALSSSLPFFSFFFITIIFLSVVKNVWTERLLKMCHRLNTNYFPAVSPHHLKAVAPCINNKTIQKELCMEEDVYGDTWKTHADPHRGLMRASQKEREKGRERLCRIMYRITIIKHCGFLHFFP